MKSIGPDTGSDIEGGVWGVTDDIFMDVHVALLRRIL
jgi:hypothetical protein